MRRIVGLAVLLIFFGASSVRAASILHQTAQGNFTSNVLGGSAWTTFTGYMTAAHTLSSTVSFGNLRRELVPGTHRAGSVTVAILHTPPVLYRDGYIPSN